MPESNTVDCYISNLTLNIVINPMRMLKEALRLIKPGKRAIFSVWGVEKDSTFFSLNIRIELKHKIKSDTSNYFRMNDMPSSIKLLEDAGFT